MHFKKPHPPEKHHNRKPVNRAPHGALRCNRLALPPMFFALAYYGYEAGWSSSALAVMLGCGVAMIERAMTLHSRELQENRAREREENESARACSGSSFVQPARRRPSCSL